MFFASRVSRRLPSRRSLLAAASAASALACMPVRAASTPGAVFTDGGRSTPWIPFEMPDFRHIIVSGAINGRPARIMLDSGVGVLALARPMAAALGLASTGIAYGVGIDGGAAGQSVAGLEVRFANLTITTPGASVYDLEAAQVAPGAPFDGLMGRDLFDALLVDIDFAAGQLALKRSDRAVRIPGGADLPVARADFGMRTIPVSIMGRAAIPALIDLGADRPFLVSPSYAADQGLLEGRRVTTTASGGVNGVEISRLASLDGVALAGASFRQVPTEIPQRWSYQAPTIVGFPVIRRYRTMFDFPNDRVCLKPTAIEQPFRKDRSGIGARRGDGRLDVVHIAAGSPAEHAGLQAGDVIVAVNGNPLTPAYFRDHPRDGAAAAGTHYAFTLADGTTKELVLADYF